MKREELVAFEHGGEYYGEFYWKEQADSVMDTMAKDYEANRKLWEAEIASLKQRVNELEDKVEQKNFFWEGCGLSKRGFKNTIAVSNYIEDLEARIDELEANQPKWISVDERLPNDEEDCLVFSSRDGVGIVFRNEKNIFEECQDLTHWMPLPPPPTTEESTAVQTPKSED